MIVLVRLGFFHFYGIDKGSWRYAGVRDLINIIKAVSLSSIALVMIIYFFLGFHQYPRSVYVIDWLILIFLIGGIRVHWRVVRELRFLETGDKKRVLLIGAGDAGEMILREMKQNPKLLYKPIGFIDDDVTKFGIKIHGVPVLGTRKELLSIVNRHNIQEIIITIASTSARQIREIVEDCERTRLDVKIIPGIDKILNGQVSLSQIREIRLDDLLYRETVRIDTTNIGVYLQSKKVLVTGAAGSIGLELCRQISQFLPDQILLFDQCESSLYFSELELKKDYPRVAFVPIIGDIQDISRVKDVMRKWPPNVIFHSAAYKHVPLLEHNPSEAVKNNIVATRNLASISKECEVDKFILISTDKAVNPTSVMGATKAVAEYYIRELSKQNHTQYVIVRFGNVLGSNGSVVPLFKKQIGDKGPVTVTHPDIKRYFMTISEAVQLVLQASVMGNGGEIFVLDMGEQVRILDLARHMINLAGHVPDQDVKIVFTGLRPGEKLYEELFDRHERVQKTEHEKIMMALSEKPQDLEVLHDQINNLERLAEKNDDNGILLKLKELVPSYEGPTDLVLNRESELETEKV